jgi:chromosome segregation ATPase
VCDSHVGLARLCAPYLGQEPTHSGPNPSVPLDFLSTDLMHQVMELALKLRGAEEAGGSTSKELKESLKRAEAATKAAERDRDIAVMEKKALEQELAASSTRARDTDTAVRRALEAEGRVTELDEQVTAKSKAEAEARVEGNALRERVVELERLLEESGKESAELAGKLAKVELDYRTAAAGAESAKREAKKIKETSEEREAAMSASLLQAEMGKTEISAQLSRARQEVASLKEEHEGVLRGKNASIEGYKSEIETLKSQAQMAVGSETDKVTRLSKNLQKFDQSFSRPSTLDSRSSTLNLNLPVSNLQSFKTTSAGSAD